jgi:hypothetical protein
MTQELNELSDKCIEEMRKNERMKMTKNDWIDYDCSIFCHLCEEEFDENVCKLSKVRDHDHRTGAFRGAAHSCCNINYFSNRYLPVVFHNLKGYDGHLFIKKAYDLAKDSNISAIPNSKEKIMSFQIKNLKFIDSFQFMAASLEQLTKNLYISIGKDEDQKPIYDHTKYDNFKNMKEHFGEHMDLLCRKGFYPYEFIDGIQKLKTQGLPPIDKFYSSLKKETITETDYKHAQKVYDELKCESFLDYHLAYLKCDVLLLADVFENFRETCYENYGLDPANYITVPSFAWDALLSITNIKLQLISDPKILTIIEKSKRGGLCFVGSQRYAKANNKYCNDYDNTKESNYLMYWDANNLYAWAMSQCLPYDDLKFDKKITIGDVLETADDNDIGYIVECDLTIPEEVHDKLKEYPPCPENIKPTADMLSPFQLQLKEQIKEECGGYSPTASNKLIPHLMEHKNYCIHYRNLKYVVELGLKITKVHNILSFKQKAWMKPYIDLNTNKRKQAKNEFEKYFSKLMNNSVFGKTMENVKNRMNLHLTTSDDNAVKWFSKPNLKDCFEFNGLYMIEMFKTEVFYDKPIYVGTSILDLSKLCMMKFHYEVINKQFENKHKLIYSDTDSMVYNIQHNDIYDWMRNNKQHFDLSDCVKQGWKGLQCKTNKKKVGVFKPELNGLIITEFLGLNPKCYSINHLVNIIDYHIKNKKTCKGVSKAVVKKEITHEDYKAVFETGTPQKRVVTSIKSINHELYTYRQEKIALSSYYDKFYMVDGNNCLPFGYKAS